MKQTAKTSEGGGQGSPLPRFLRGIFRGPGVKNAGAASEVAPDSPGAAPEPAPVFASREHPPKILVVDDDPVVLKTMEIKLSRAGCQVVQAHDGAEAITTARKEQPDVIVLDIGLPADVSVAWDGVRVMQWIKRVENGEAPPVIIITGSHTAGLREHALANGAVAFFLKPVDNEKLIEAIGAALAAPRAKTTPLEKSLVMAVVASAPTSAPTCAPASVTANTDAKSPGFALY